MENLSGMFFQLYSRSFFQLSSTNAFQFVMHDRRMEDTPDGNKQQNNSKNLSHLSYSRGRYDGNKMFEACHDLENLRTF